MVQIYLAVCGLDFSFPPGLEKPRPQERIDAFSTAHASDPRFTGQYLRFLRRSGCIRCALYERSLMPQTEEISSREESQHRNGAGRPGRFSGTGERSVFGVNGIMVPLAGLEPARPCGQQILSLPRLPIPPQGPIATDEEAECIHRAFCVNGRCWQRQIDRLKGRPSDRNQARR